MLYGSKPVDGGAYLFSEVEKDEFLIKTPQAIKYFKPYYESRYTYSSSLVYNNFPFPKNPTEKQVKDIEDKAQKVLDARAKYPDSSLADLYNPLTMPPELVKAHNELDKAVDAAYGKTNFKNERERIEFLFNLYQQYISEIPQKKTKKKK